MSLGGSGVSICHRRGQDSEGRIIFYRLNGFFIEEWLCEVFAKKETPGTPVAARFTKCIFFGSFNGNLENIPFQLGVMHHNWLSDFDPSRVDS